MTLKFSATSNNSLISKTNVTKGYRVGWNLSRFGGSYSQSINFFSIHWEINSGSPNIVRFHIESPKEEKDAKLNSIKHRIITELKDNITEIGALVKSGVIKDSTRTNNLENIKRYKSSEVFHVVLDENVIYERATRSIRLVDNDLGESINNYVSKYSEELKKLNLRIL